MTATLLTGIAELSSFTRWFGKHFHQSPSSWRQQQQVLDARVPEPPA